MQRVLSSFSRAFRKSTIRPLSTATVPKTTSTPTTSKMGSVTTTNADTFIELVKGRRTFYPLNKELTISTSRIQTIVSELLQHVPSSFNSQSNRAVILFGAEHDKLWDITRDILKAIVPAEQWQSTADKMAMFKAGAGTVLFFEDEAPIKALQEQFPPYADKYVDLYLVLELQWGAGWLTSENKVPYLRRPQQRHASLRRLDCPRGRGARRQPAALQPAD
jgi:hypothetical protein